LNVAPRPPDESEEQLIGVEDAEPEVVPLEEYRVTRLEPVTLVSTPRRQRGGRLRAAGQRTGPAHMDVAARNYGHIHGDLIRIALIATIMFGVIIALSFVLK